MRLVDTREPWNLREALIKTGWEQKALESGDMCFDTHDSLTVGCTRKTLGDLLNSVGDIFAYQLEAMLERYDICIFMFEADKIRQNTDGHIITTRVGERGMQEDIIHRFTRAELFNWLHRWQAKGFILERWPTMDYMVIRLNELYALYQKPYSLSGKSRKHADDRILALCSGLRGKIGQKALDEHSIAELCKMDIDELNSVDGFGAKRAAALYNHLHRKPNNIKEGE